MSMEYLSAAELGWKQGVGHADCVPWTGPRKSISLREGFRRLFFFQWITEVYGPSVQPRAECTAGVSRLSLEPSVGWGWGELDLAEPALRYL